MKNLIVFITLFLSVSTIYGQLVVSDPVMTNLQVISNSYSMATSTYSQLGSQLQSGTLDMVTKNADIATKSLDMLQKAVDVANIFLGSQMALDFFYNQQMIISKIRQVSQDMYSIPADVLRKNVRDQVIQNLDDGFVTATKSLQVAKNAFVSKQLNLSERLTYIDAANKYLQKSEMNINTAIGIIANARLVSNRLQNRTGVIKLLY